jgi:hypothetical protein
MADSFRVIVNVERIRANLAAAEGGELTDADVHEFLLSSGFIPDGDANAWIAEDVSLTVLGKDEIVSMLPV